MLLVVIKGVVGVKNLIKASYFVEGPQTAINYYYNFFRTICHLDVILF